MVSKGKPEGFSTSYQPKYRFSHNSIYEATILYLIRKLPIVAFSFLSINTNFSKINSSVYLFLYVFLLNSRKKE